MTPDEILEYVGEFEDEDVVTFPDLKDALIGYAQPWDSSGCRPTRLIYDGHKCLEILKNRDGMDDTEAMVWVSECTEGGYVGPSTPIVMWSNYA